MSDIKPDPSRWAVEVRGLTKRLLCRKRLPPGYSLGPAHWIVSGLARLGGRAEWKTPLDGVDLKVARGELLGLLGANGAGKTTLLKCLSTLLEPDGGDAFVNGFNVRTQPDQVRLSLNLVGSGHWVAFDWNLTVEKNLEFFGTLYGLSRRERCSRTGEVMEMLGIARLARATPRTLSTGERQRMLLAKGFLARTPVMFLDEPTVGLDINGAREVRMLIRRQLSSSAAISGVLTTHRIEEAESLCRRIAVMDRGRIIACGTPAELKVLAAPAGWVQVRAAAMSPAALQAVRGARGVKSAVCSTEHERAECRVRVECRDARAVEEVVAAIRSQAGRILAIDAREPSLEDAYLSLIEKRAGR
jgi:ABC-2 type transport system ATP-binding protein